jgi:hypothetical protein
MTACLSSSLPAGWERDIAWGLIRLSPPPGSGNRPAVMEGRGVRTGRGPRQGEMYRQLRSGDDVGIESFTISPQSAPHFRIDFDSLIGPRPLIDNRAMDGFVSRYEAQAEAAFNLRGAVLQRTRPRRRSRVAPFPPLRYRRTCAAMLCPRDGDGAPRIRKKSYITGEAVPASSRPQDGIDRID